MRLLVGLIKDLGLGLAVSVPIVALFMLLIRDPLVAAVLLAVGIVYGVGVAVRTFWFG